jgi:hypothetical protein
MAGRSSPQCPQHPFQASFVDAAFDPHPHPHTLGSSISIRPPVCASCGGSRCIAFGVSVATVTGVNRTVAPNSVAASWRRQLWIRPRVMWCRRDISDTVLPGADASVRIAFFSSAL